MRGADEGEKGEEELQIAVANRQLQGMSRTPGPERGEKEDGQNIE
jgi:hypothetical protein